MVRLSDSAVVYHLTYRLEATSANGRHVFEAQLTMSIVFELSSREFTEADLQAFGVIGALDIVHPYVREMVHSLTVRMGLPPLVLDVKTPPNMLSLAADSRP
jgi:preprotein translocase subunit SecB